MKIFLELPCWPQNLGQIWLSPIIKIVAINAKQIYLCHKIPFSENYIILKCTHRRVSHFVEI